MQLKKVIRNKEYHHGDLRNALIETAAKLAAERGIAALSLREVAREAGVSHAAPYHHFNDKNGLLAAVAEEGFRRFDTYQDRALRNAPSEPRERLKSLGRAYVRFAMANPHYFRVMFRRDFVQPDRYPSLATVADRTFARLIDTVRQCRESHGDKDQDAMPFAIRAWALVHGLATLWLDGPLKKMKVNQKSIDAVIDLLA